MSEAFSLKWENFQYNVSKSFGLLRNEDYLHDVTLVGDDHKQVSAHKLVLSACSEYFKDIFKNNNKPNVYPLLCLNGISKDDLNNVMDYIYNGEVQLYQANLQRFLDVAQRLKLEGMMDMGNQEEDEDPLDEKVITKMELDETEEVASPEEVLSSRKVESPPNTKMVAMSSEELNDLDATINKYIEECGGDEYTTRLKCKICGRESTSLRVNMKNHIETHLEGLSFPCKACEKTFRTRNVLATHKTKVHKRVHKRDRKSLGKTENILKTDPDEKESPLPSQKEAMLNSKLHQQFPDLNPNLRLG